MTRVEWRFQRLGTSVTSCWRRSCSVSPKWSPGGPIRTTPRGGRSLWGGRQDLCQDLWPLFQTRGEGGLSWELDLHGRSRQGGSPAPTSRQTLGCLLSFLRGVPGHRFFYQGSDSFRLSESYSSGRGQHPPGFWIPPEGGSAENIALDCKVQELIRAFHSVKQEVQAKQEQDQAFYQRWQRLGSDVEPFVSEFGGPPLERLRSRSPDLGRPETPESGRRPPEAAASREQPLSTFSRGGVPERESARAYYDLGRGGAGQPSSPPHPTMGEARRRRFGDRGSAPWEDPYSHLLGTPVEPSAGNFLKTMGARRQELYQQGASGSQGSGPLSPGQGQVHRDPEPQGGGQLRGSPVQVVCAGAVPPGLPHTVVLPAVCVCARACGFKA